MDDEKNVLILSPFFPPRSGAGVYRWAKFSKYLNDFGWTPVIITAPIFKNDKLDISIWNEIKDKIKIIYPAEYPKAQSTWWFEGKNTGLKYLLMGIINNTLFIPDLFIRYLPQFIASGICVCRKQKIHTIIATGSPFSTFIISTLISKFTKLPLVLDFRDLWTDDYFVKRKKPHVQVLLKCMEAWAVRNASAVISVTDDMTQLLKHKYNTCSNIEFCTITNGYDEDDFCDPIVQLESKELIFCHVGTWNAAHPLENFFKGLKISFDQKPEMQDRIRVVLCGQISNNQSDFIKDIGLAESVIYYGQIDHAEAIKIMLNSHIQILSMANLEHYSSYYSGKIFEYLRVRKEILGIIPEGVAANLIREVEAGTIVDPDNIIAISSIIIKYYEQFSNDLSMFIRKDDQYAQKVYRFNRKYLASELARLLNKLENQCNE